MTEKRFEMKTRNMKITKRSGKKLANIKHERYWFEREK